MTGELISPHDPRWNDFLSQVQHDFYHLPGYVSVAAGREDGEAAAFLVGDGSNGLLIPLVVRRLPEHLGAPDGCLDAVSPYGYPSPLLPPRLKVKQVEKMVQSFVEFGREGGFVTAFIRFHPLFNCHLDGFGRHGAIVRHGETVYIDLTIDDETYWRTLRDNHRRSIRRLQQAGFVAKMDDWSGWEAFLAVYAETMERLNADSYYRFDRSYFDNLRSALGNKLHLCMVVTPSGEVAAAGLFATINGSVGYHLGGTCGFYLRQAPAKLMFHHVRSWAKRSGLRTFHLGGGVGGSNDSLFHFKSGFSALTSGFHTGRVVFDQERYLWLCGNSRYGGGNISAGGYFPAYRCTSIPREGSNE